MSSDEQQAKAQEFLQRIKKVVAKADEAKQIYRLTTEQVAQKVMDLISHQGYKIEGVYTLTRDEAIELLEQLIMNPQIEKFELKIQQDNIFIKDLNEG